MPEKVIIRISQKSTLELSDVHPMEKLIKVLNDNKDLIKQLLSFHHYEDKAKVDQLDIESLNAATERNGTFKVKYKTEYFLGCSDVHYTENKSMLITYYLDTEEACIILEGEPKLERFDEL